MQKVKNLRIRKIKLSPKHLVSFGKFFIAHNNISDHNWIVVSLVSNSAVVNFVTN